jgi:uncharacterized protein
MKTEPWYRQPWPWILMAGPAFVIVAGVAMATLAFRSADGVVAEDYYKRGLGINRVLAREARAEAIGLQAEVRLERGRVAASVSAREKLPERIQLTLAHPTRAGEDRVAWLVHVDGDRYEAPLPGLAKGRWRMILETPQWRWSALGEARG